MVQRSGSLYCALLLFPDSYGADSEKSAEGKNGMDQLPFQPSAGGYDWGRQSGDGAPYVCLSGRRASVSDRDKKKKKALVCGGAACGQCRGIWGQYSRAGQLAETGRGGRTLKSGGICFPFLLLRLLLHRGMDG